MYHYKLLIFNRDPGDAKVLLPGDFMKILLIVILLLSAAFYSFSSSDKDRRVELMELVDGASWAKFECKYPENNIECEIVGKDRLAKTEEFESDLKIMWKYTDMVKRELAKDGWNGQLRIRYKEKTYL